MLKFPLVTAGLVFAVIAAPVPAHADPVYPPSYGSNGTFAVGTQTRDGLSSFIPPGRYQVEEAPGIFKAPGFWLRCSAVPCHPTYPGHIIAHGAPSEGATLVELLPTDTAVYLFNVTLNFAG